MEDKLISIVEKINEICKKELKELYSFSSFKTEVIHFNSENIAINIECVVFVFYNNLSQNIIIKTNNFDELFIKLEEELKKINNNDR